jgi:riboflavin kinase/FMN adenylyltransferase
MTVPPPLQSAFPVVRNGDALPASLAGAIVAIGNFDGMHRGHAAVITAATARAKDEGRPALALTFEPHPRSFFRPDEPLFRLTPEPAKLRLLAAAGLHGVVVMTFDKALANRSAEDFVAKSLVERLRIAGVVVGADFRFGRGRLGTAQLLMEESGRHGFSVEAIEHVRLEGRPVTSGAVRMALAGGSIAEAAELLGHSWFVEGKVVRGAGRGRTLGFPTANLSIDPSCGLLHGIYAARTHVGGASHDSVASFGCRPQFDNGTPVLEVMLFEFDADLYGRPLTIEFVGFIRAEQKFDSVEALQARMDRDVAEARAMLARTGKP